MTPNDIILLLTRLLGPLKIQPQKVDADFNKFQGMLGAALTQPALEINTTGVQFPDYQSYRLPEEIIEELDKIADEITAAQPHRKPTDPVFRLRRRDLPVTAGFEESAENFMDPDFSFGPFINRQSKKVWFDFFQVHKQLRFEILQGGIPDFLVITLPLNNPLPDAGRHKTLTFDDCTVWINLKAIAQNADKKFVGIRAKNCVITTDGIIAVQATGFASVLSPAFQMSFEPFDKFANGNDNNAPPKAAYPDKIIFSCTGTKWLLQSFAKSLININGDSIELAEGANINPVYLEPESLIHFPLQAGKNSWEIISNTTDRFRLSGKTELTNPGWYLPVISTDNSAGTGGLGTNIFSGYLGFRGQAGLELNWPGLENGNLTISKFLLLARPGRMNLKYSYTAPARSKQQLATWKASSGNDDRSATTIKPLPSGEGICIDDNQQMEFLFQSANISAKADRPLNTNEQRFDISGHKGAAVFIKIKDSTAVYILGSHPTPVADVVKKRRIPQSLCLRNALLTTDNPLSIFLEGKLLTDEIISEGFFYLVFPVYRLINTLPDPYISNQDGIFDSDELKLFNHLWQTGQDTLINPFHFSVTATVQWNEDATTVEFSMNQRPAAGKLSNDELSRMAAASGNLCKDANANAAGNFSQPKGINDARRTDPENIAGAYDFMQLLPGNRLLVDVSGSANLWGVSFSDTIPGNRTQLAESLGFPASFPYRIKNMDLVSSGRMSRLFTLPHIQWEPVMRVENTLVPEADVVPPIINFSNNGNPTRISSAQKAEVILAPKKLYQFILDGFNKVEKPHGAAANFTLPFGICAFAYFNPNKIVGLPSAKACANEPAFTSKKTGELSGGMQLHINALPVTPLKGKSVADKQAYFIGSATQMPTAADNSNNILGQKILSQFAEFSNSFTAKVPLERIDFSGYGASIFSNWLNESANFGRVSQVKFDVLVGRTAHEVIQIKSILFPWAVPVVRSIVIQRKNTGIVTRYDSGWVAQGPGEFDFRSHTDIGGIRPEGNPYNFHPGMVKGIYNVREIRELPDTMDLLIENKLKQKIRFSGVYFNGDIQIENIIKGGLPKTATIPQRVHSVGQFGYVMLADPKFVNDTTKLTELFPAESFKNLLTNPKIGGSLGGPVNAVMNIASTGQRMQVSRVDISASSEANTTFVVAVRGTIELPKEGSWTVVKCLPSKDIIPLNPAEAVPVIRNGLLNIITGNIAFNNSSHCLGDPAEIDKYAPLAAAPALQYSLLQTTGTQKLLFRRPSFSEKIPQKMATDTPDLADAFRLLKCKTVFPNLSGTLSLPEIVKSLNITGDGSGLKFPEEFFSGNGNLNEFVPPQLKKDATAKEFELLNESGLQIIISYSSKEKSDNESKFQVDLNSDAIDNALDGERKKWQTVNKDVAIKVNLGSIKPLLTLRGTFRSEAGKDPEFENPQCELGDELQAVKDILQILALLAGKGKSDNLKVVMGNNPGVYNYKMSIDQNIPVIQFPSIEEITLSTPPPLIIEASLSLGVFFNLSLSPDPKNLIKPGAGAVFGFEGMIQIQLITIGIAAAYGVGITKVKAYVDFSDPTPQFEFTFGFGATVIVDLPVVGLVSVTRSFSLTGNINEHGFLAVAGQMLRGVLSLAGGLLVVAIQIEGKAGVERKNKIDKNDTKTTALFEMIFSLDVSLAFVISYDFSKSYTEEIALN
jgi:hypothetical protein